MLGACNRDIEDVEPSYADKNYFAVADKPGELNQLLYKIYVDTGVPIFVSDTLSVETYTNANGEEVSRVELLDLSYDIFGSATEQISDSIKDPRVVLCGDEAAMIKAAELMRDKVIPYLPKSGEGRGKCYFLVDSLKTQREWRNWTTYTQEKAWTDFTIYNMTQGVVVGGLSEILTMTPEEQDLWCGRVIGAKTTAWLMENKTEELDSFYSVTNEGRTLIQNYYNKYYDVVLSDYHSDMVEAAGMFGWYAEAPELDGGQRWTFTQEGDVMEYVARAYLYRGREDEFLSDYAPESKVYRKFQVIRELVDEFEATFGNAEQ